MEWMLLCNVYMGFFSIYFSVCLFVLHNGRFGVLRTYAKHDDCRWKDLFAVKANSYQLSLHKMRSFPVLC